MNNPYVLLRLLLALDIMICTVGIVIPVFGSYGLLEMVADVPRFDGIDFLVHLLWLVNISVMLISWIGLFFVKNWARILYLVPVVIMMTSSFLKGNAGYSPGIFALMQDVVVLYYGFFICMLFFWSCFNFVS